MWQAGWSRTEIGVKAQGYAMMGYGMWHNRARGHDTPLYARAFALRDAAGRTLWFACLDLGYITYAMRSGVLAGLRATLGDSVEDALLVLTCTHTHSGPGGCTHDALYNVVTPGFVPENLDAVVSATVDALLAAHAGLAPTGLSLHQGEFGLHVPVAWNRSLRAYNRNPDVTPQPETNAHAALDRRMPVLGFYRDGRLEAMLSLFGVHATCVGNTLDKYSGDNKGYASMNVEQRWREDGIENAVAVFAQATAGDVSPHYHGPGDVARRARITGQAEYEYAANNGRLQAEEALSVLASPGVTLEGGLDGLLSYADFSRQHADPRFANGHPEALTSDPCHGVAFFTGTRVDGPGMPTLLGKAAAGIARRLRASRLRPGSPLSASEREYYRRLYAAQGPKDILLEAGRKRILGRALDALPLPGFVDPLVGELKRQAAAGAIRESALVPTVLPVQLVRIGGLALVCCPGEFTTTAGRRVVATVREALGAAVDDVLICTYCNDYMGYVTTREEYQEQAYEGGHTIFGQWTLAAFQTRFDALARESLKPVGERHHDTHTRPLPAPPEELARRTNVPVPRRA